MFTKSKIAILATLVTVVAAPAFAGDQDTATELRDSGRYVPELVMPVRATAYSGAYASAVTPAHFHVSKRGNANRSGDFQLQGR